MQDNRQTYNFDEYIRQGEPEQRQKAENWQIAIGLQAVDGLKPSRYLIETAQRHIAGEMDINAVKQSINAYYKTSEGRKQAEDGTEEADKVSANIAELLAEKAFSLIPAEYSRIHRRIFSGVMKHAGEYRKYNITKKEWVLDGDTITYAPYELLQETLEYDFSQEKKFSFKGLGEHEIIAHLCHFIAGLWQIHPFGEGNTRTTAVFTIKYLQTLGFKASNDVFKEHSWYFRNALVRANYNNSEKGISSTTVFLERFFENILFGAKHELKNRYCHIYWKDVPDNHRATTRQVPDKYRTTTQQVPNKYPTSLQIEQLINIIGEAQLSVAEMLLKLGLKDRVNFINNYLSPAISGGFVRMLYPESPHHPRQKYLLTEAGREAINL